ncbi:MAG: imidazole glycerol phosphate synthase subunit HisH [Actinobacteria bacterium]|nr:imidazole glycerol phosphate synthase subunit HisH [Actinomycetota bacterium]
MTQPRVAVLDYEAGNVRSAQRGLERAGAAAFITDAAHEAGDADALLVPGVGHFSTCLANLRAAGLEELLRSWIAEDRPVLGICVGMQLLYEHSDEGDVPGLGVLPGRVLRLPEDAVVPHMGWDVLTPAPGHEEDPLLAGVAGERAYFVHGYYAQPSDPAHVVATCSYGGVDFPCLARVGNVVGTQFHPEKSADVGARLLANWVASLG